MAKQKPNEILAEALIAAKDASREKGVLKHSDIDAKYIQILKKGQWLTPVIRGWYLLNKPDVSGSSTVWYVGFWDFIKAYLNDRFGQDKYCLSAEASVSLFTAEEHIFRQITVITKKPSNQLIQLPFDTSILLYTDDKNYPKNTQVTNGLTTMTLPLALTRLSPSYFHSKPLNVEIALKSLNSVSEVSRILLDHSLIASSSRLAGAFKALNENKQSEQIIEDMSAAGFNIEATNPFEKYTPLLNSGEKIRSPYTGRIQALWKKMRPVVIENFSKPPGLAAVDKKKIMRLIKDRYTQDAYHSLSIEGYEVSTELIEKIQKGQWNPDNNPKDQGHKDAMAAKGYYDAFCKVIESIAKILLDKNDSSQVFNDDLQTWYRALFSPSVQAGIVKPSDLAGFRNSPVYIKNARHVPPRSEAVLDAMDTLFSLLKNEEHAGVRAILGHFIFVYIHPYMDGNGRIGRFLMNLMLTSGGYDWTIIRTEKRSEYMKALDAASSDENILPFTEFVKAEMEYWEDN